MKTYKLLRDHPKFQKAKPLDIVIKENLDPKSFDILNNPNEYNQLMLRFAYEVGDLEMINYFLKDLHSEESNSKENINLTKHEQCKNKDKKSWIIYFFAGICIGLALSCFIVVTASMSAIIGIALAGILIGIGCSIICDNKVDTKIKTCHHNGITNFKHSLEL